MCVLLGPSGKSLSHGHLVLYFLKEINNISPNYTLKNRTKIFIYCYGLQHLWYNQLANSFHQTGMQMYNWVCHAVTNSGYHHSLYERCPLEFTMHNMCQHTPQSCFQNWRLHPRAELFPAMPSWSARERWKYWLICAIKMSKKM